MKSIKRTGLKTLAVLIVLQLVLMLCFAIPASAEADAPINADYKTGKVTLSLVELTPDEEHSLMIFAPGFTGEPDVTSDKLVAIDQFRADESGSAELEAKIGSPIPNKDYYAYINGELYGTFQFEKEEGGDGPLLGDVNDSKDVKIDDALMIQKYVAKLITFSAEQKLVADTYTSDGAGIINLKDVLEVQKFVAGKLPDTTLVGKPISI